MVAEHINYKAQGNEIWSFIVIIMSLYIKTALILRAVIEIIRQAKLTLLNRYCRRLIMVQNHH